MNKRTIPINQFEGSTIGSKMCNRLYSSNSSSSRIEQIMQQKGSRRSKLRKSTARTLPDCLSVLLMLSKKLPIQAVIGTTQSCMPRKLPKHGLKYNKLILDYKQL
jgi:hypothetical protein